MSSSSSSASSGTGGEQIYWGAYVDPGQYGLPHVTLDMRAVEMFKSHAGKKVSLVHFGVVVGESRFRGVGE